MASMAKTRTPEIQAAPRSDARLNEEQVRNTAGESPDEQSRIARRAYELYLERGGSHGQDWDDWLTAEREVRGREPTRND